MLGHGIPIQTLMTAVGCCISLSFPQTAGDSIVPRPQSLLSMEAPVPMDRELTIESCNSERVRAEFMEMAGEWGISVVSQAGSGRCARLRVTYGASPTAETDSNENGAQGYTLRTSDSSAGTVMEIRGGDEAGAFFAIQTLRQLLAVRDGALSIRPARIADWPAIRRRGIIMGYQESTAHFKRTIDYLARLKMSLILDCNLRGTNFAGPMDSLLVRQLREVAPYCDSHFIELTALLGYGNALAQMGDAVVPYYLDRLRAGIRSFTIDFDDMRINSLAEAESLAQIHGAVAARIIRSLRQTDSAARFIFCPVPYGGRPSTLFNYASGPDGARYLNIISDSLPADVPVFWTGDANYSVSGATVEGALDFSSAIGGRKPFSWDNSSLLFAPAHRPMSGRESGLYRHISGYVANLAETVSWWPDDADVRFSLATMAMYCWNPLSYSPSGDSATAERFVSSLPSLYVFDTALVRRINFQVSGTPFREGWMPDNGGAYRAWGPWGMGCGWLSLGTFSTRDSRNGSNFLFKSILSVAGTGTYKINVADGEYAIRVGMGDNAYGVSYYDWTAWGSDTICRKLPGSANSVCTDTVRAACGEGITLTVKGTICYIVAASTRDGTDINDVADDGYLPPASTETTGAPGAESLAAAPNPFNPSVTLRLFVPEGRNCVVRILDASGKLVRTLDMGFVRPGAAAMRWDGKDGFGRPVAAGLYLACASVGVKNLSTKLALVR